MAAHISPASVLFTLNSYSFKYFLEIGDSKKKLLSYGQNIPVDEEKDTFFCNAYWSQDIVASIITALRA
jgi:hypothetical protein